MSAILREVQRVLIRGEEIRYERTDSAIVPLSLGTATAPH
jgi:hypothetical protein